MLGEIYCPCSKLHPHEFIGWFSDAWREPANAELQRL